MFSGYKDKYLRAPGTNRRDPVAEHVTLSCWSWCRSPVSRGRTRRRSGTCWQLYFAANARGLVCYPCTVSHAKSAKICPGTCNAPSRLRALRVRLYCPRTENSRRSARRTRRLVLGTCNAPPRPTREARTPSVLKTPALPRRLRAGCVDSTCPKAAGGFAVLFTPGHRHPHLVPPLRGRTAAGSRQTPGSCRR